MLHRKARTAAPDRGDDFRQDGIRRPCARGKASEVIGAETLQKFVEAGTVVEVAQVAELVQQHIVAERSGQADKVEVQVYVPFCGAAAPVGGIVLDADAAVCETVADGKARKFLRKQRGSLFAQQLHQDRHKRRRQCPAALGRQRVRIPDFLMYGRALHARDGPSGLSRIHGRSHCYRKTRQTGSIAKSSGMTFFCMDMFLSFSFIIRYATKTISTGFIASEG